MPTFKLDDREIPFEKGETIIQAAYKLGTEIPSYCWHPGLSIAANCRMCLVEIDPPAGGRPMLLDIMKWDEDKKSYILDRKPKLQPACQMQATEGMVVRSQNSPHVAEARAHVQEFLLLNHPVDCPICDQSGECKLQDYYMSEQRTPKRMLDEPVHKPKGVPFGETIVYDGERCIACTRCVRVCDELAGDHMLDMRERGNRNEIMVAPGRKLEGNYTLMTEHVCPVGALTSSHFRFKARVWTLKPHASVCTGCATGCNTWIDVDPRENRAYRLRPRDNESVNRYWMCDDGMMTYLKAHAKRVTEALVGRSEARQSVTVEAAIQKAAGELKKVPRAKLAVVLSAQASSEDNLVAAEFARQTGASLYLGAKAGWQGDKILRHSDQNPNRAGAKLLCAGAPLGSLSDLLDSVGKGEIQGALVLGTDVDCDESRLTALSRVGTVVVLASHEGPLGSLATVTLPVTAWAEHEGTFVNATGLAQTFTRAIHPREGTPGAWDAIARVGRAMGLDLAYKKFKEVRAALDARFSAAKGEGPSQTSEATVEPQQA